MEGWDSSFHDRYSALHVPIMVETALPVEVDIVKNDAENADRPAVLYLDDSFRRANALASELGECVNGRRREQSFEPRLRQAKDFVIRVYQDGPERN